MNTQKVNEKHQPAEANKQKTSSTLQSQPVSQTSSTTRNFEEIKSCAQKQIEGHEDLRSMSIRVHAALCFANTILESTLRNRTRMNDVTMMGRAFDLADALIKAASEHKPVTANEGFEVAFSVAKPVTR